MSTSRVADMLQPGKRWEYPTPLWLFRELDAEFGPFDLDPCASEENHKCPHYFTQEQNGLAQPWWGKVFMNPPYGPTIPLWVEKARQEAKRGVLVVGLLPVRTDTEWWHRSVEGHATVRFLKGRVNFTGKNPPFASCIVIWKPAPAAGSSG